MSSIWDRAEEEFPSQSPSSPAPLPRSIVYVDGQPIRVTVTDVNMPFASMVGFMIKWALAAIPAMIILAFIIGFGVAALGAIFAEMFKGL